MKLIKKVEVLFGIEEAAREVAKLSDGDLRRFLEKVIEYRKNRLDEKTTKATQSVCEGVRLLTE